MRELILAGFGEAILDAGKPVPGGLLGPRGRAVGNRFGVYRNNFVVGLSTALAESFPVIRKLVGDEFFMAMANVFVRSHLPKSPLMMYYGDDFPSFLDSFPPVTKFPYLPDVARLEHARRLAFHAADCVPVGAAALAAVAEASLPAVRFRLLPSVHLVRSKFPIFSIWRYNATPDQSPLAAHGEDVLIARPFGDVEIRPLPAGAHAFLSSMLAGETLSRAIEIGNSASSEFDPTAQIGGVLQSNILAEIYQ